MSELYNYEYYHNCCGPIAYEEPARWVEFFGNVADRIVKDLRPKTVLDAGCAMGYLVAALRDCGVEAYGIDISEYAISKVREDIRSYCVVGSLTEPLPESLPKRYDLVVTIEVLEHLYAEEGRKAIHNLCALTDQIIFSSTPEDFTESTHVNVQQREYWARIFAEEGFFDNINYRPTYLTYHASYFQRKEDWLRQLEDYERNIRMSEARQRADQANYAKALEDKERHIQNQAAMLERAERQRQDLANDYETRLVEAAQERHTVETQYEELLAKATEERQISEEHYKERLTEAAQEHQAAKSRYEELLAEAVQERQAAERRHEELTAAAVREYQASQNHYEERLAEDSQKRMQLETLYKKKLEAAKQELLECERHYQELAELKRQKYAKILEQKSQKEQQSIEQLRQQKAETNQIRAELANSKILAEWQGQELAHYKEHYFAAINQREELKKELAHYQEHYLAVINQRETLKQELEQAQIAYNVISNATFWKITKPFRFTLDVIKAVFRKSYKMRLISKGIRCWKEKGFAYTWRKVKDYRHHRQKFERAHFPIFTPEELEAQKTDVFLRDIKFSVLVPLYNTPEKFLNEMIYSVLDQTYANWELCLADGSDNAHKEIGKICKQYAKENKRIRYRKLKENMGISGNTNACIEMSTGDYIALFDHDDLLHPAALHEVMRAICEQDADFIYTDENTFHNTPEDAYYPHFKPDFAPDTLRTNNYICHLTVFARSLLDVVGGFRSEFDGSQDYDMVLRLTEQAHKIVHIPKILYYWRAHANSVAEGIEAKPYVLSAARRAISEHMKRVGLEGEVLDYVVTSMYRIRYKIHEFPLVSIIIPNKDHKEDLKKCIQSIFYNTIYPDWEIVIVENNSTEEETFSYYSELDEDKRIRVIYWQGKFNYSAITNFGAQNASGEYFLLLNNDVEIITPDWIEQMMMFGQRADVGAVGCMLYYPDNTIQHAGVIVGLGGVAAHSHKHFKRGEYGYMGRLTIAQNLSAVTAACMLVRRNVWEEVDGLDESFEVAFNDVDLCLRIRRAGYLIVWTPYAELYHYESKSRGFEDTPEKQKRFQGEIRRFQARWQAELAAGDPYYNPNLTLDREDFSLR